MGLFEGCLLACDVDGTLVKNGILNERNIEKIEFFMSEGGAFSLSTGRSVGAVSPILRQLKRVSPSVVANGCMVYDYENSKILYEKILPEKDYYITEKIMNLGLDIGIEAHGGDEVYTIVENAETYDHRTYEEFSSYIVSFEEAKKHKWNKVIFLFKNYDDLKTVKEMLSKEETDCEFSDTSAFIYGRKRIYHEQFPQGVSKATAIEALCKILNIKNGRLFAMGDYYNDLEMLKKADICAVPQGTPDDIKVFADFVAGPCEDGAVADFIEYLTKRIGE